MGTNRLWNRVGKALRQVTGWRGDVRTLGATLLREEAVRRRFGVVVVAVLVCAYALGVFGYVLSTPEIGVRCAFTPVVNHFYREFLYPEEQPPLREGDRIESVGEHPVENWPQLLRAVMRLHDEPAEPVPGVSAADLLAGREPQGRGDLLLDGHHLVRVRYARPGEEGLRVVWCRVGPPRVEALVPSVLYFFLKIGLFGVGALVLWKRPQDRSAARFFWLCVVSFGAYMGGYHWACIATQPVLLLGFTVCALLLPAVSLHFYLVFPRPKAVLERRPGAVLAAVYAPPALFFLLMLLDYLHLRGLSPAGAATPEGVRVLLARLLGEIYCYFAVAAVGYLASVVCLLHSFRTATGATERNQVKWILFGSLAALVPIGYSLYLAFWEKGRFGGGAATWPMFAASVCVTGAFTISITRYRLMQLDQLVSSGFVYFLVSSLAGLVYYGLVFAGMVLWGSQVSEGPSLAQVLGVSSTALVLVVALDLARTRIKRALDRHFRREKSQLDRTLERMRQAVEQLVDPPALGRRLLHTSAELLGAGRGAVYLRRGEPALYHLADALGPAPPLAELSSGCPLVEALHTRAALAPPAGGPPDPAQRQLLFLGGEAAHALTHEGQLLGLLILGPRPGGPYTPEDRNLLAAFAQITVLALVGAEGHRTIEGLNRDLQHKVEKIAEQQRRILVLQSQLTSRAPRTEEPEARPDPTPAAAGADELPEGVVGSGPRMRQMMHLVRKVAASPSAVLLRGESGTGKEVLARVLHEHSPRASRPFIKVHCAALSPGLLESELFGHVKGAFTSAVRDKVGRFESAHGGTLFLDEIGDISLEVQTKLLRVLQEMTFERVGSSEPVRVDVRIIAATHQDLEALMQTSRFREDLFFRLNVFPIVLPPLRERVEDVAELALHFLKLFAQRAGKGVMGIDDDALLLLKAYRWPGNIRQLENVVERAVVIADGPLVTVRELPDELLAEATGEASPGGDGADEGVPWPVLAPSAALDGRGAAPLTAALRAERERREREHLVRALAAAGGNKAEAARALGVARSTLVSRLKRLGLS